MSRGDAARRITIRDVAERANVSISTVSHTFSGSRPISAGTRQRVMAAATELGYDPNPSARSLRTGRSGIVGLILRPRFAVAGSPDRAETFNRLTGAVVTETLRRKVALVHVPDIHDPAVAGVPMDGCIVAHPYGMDTVLSELMRRRVPVVTIEEDPDRPDLGWAVRLDYAGKVPILLDHLASQGAEQIMLLTGTEDNAWNRRTHQAYLAWSEATGRTPVVDHLSEGLTPEDAAARAGSMLSSAERPDAVVVDTMDFAAALLARAQETGLSVPADLMIAALTDSEHARMASPEITALDLSHELLAASAVDLVLRRVAGEAEPAEALVVEPGLRFRGSTDRSGLAPTPSGAAAG